ncbi:MAG TPA: cytochrome c peroxidase [Kofleriaceae bacterium]|nr:cytochrome c peroxidase [Kofleriaceae bacterium]
MKAPAVLAVLAACTASPSETAGTASSSIVLVPDAGRLAVVDPDQGTVSFLDPDTLALTGQVTVGGEPHDLVLVAGELWVSTFRGGEVVAIDPVAMAVTRRASVCSGPRGMAVAHDGSFVAVACEWSGSVMEIDPGSFAATEIASDLVRPRAIAIVGDSTFVGEYTGGDVIELAGGGARTLSLVPEHAPYRPALEHMTANLVEAILPAFGELHVAHELVNHTGDASEVVADDYGSVLDGDPKINPAVSSFDLACQPTGAPVLYARFDGSSRAASGPVALAALPPHYLLVAHVSSNSVAVIDTRASSPDTREVASYAVGAGPSGIAVDAANARAFVDNAFDGSVSVIDLSWPLDGATAPRYAARQTLVRAQAPVYSAAALAGRKLFYDATNSHVTPSGVLACATCHPSGGDDGLVWFISTSDIPTKRRRTPNLANAHTGTEPYHWDGQFASMADLVHGTVTDLMAGDGLLVDGTTVQAYIDEIVAPPVPPAGDPAQIARGQAVFASAQAGCAGCHVPPLGTDGKRWSVLSPMSLSPDDAVTETNTPGLEGLFLLAPYFHDGRSDSLRDLLTRSDAAAHGGAAGLSPTDLDDLVAYLRSL